MAGVNGCTSGGPQPFETLSASLRAQAESADRSAAIARQEQAQQTTVIASVQPTPTTRSAVTEFRGNRVNIET